MKSNPKPDISTPEEKKQVKRSNEFGLLHFERTDVPREPADYGWNGESLEEFRHSNEKIRDEQIREDILEVLSIDFNLDPTDFTVEVNEGHVILSGVVKNSELSEKIEDMIEGQHGVKTVQNDLIIDDDT